MNKNIIASIIIGVAFIVGIIIYANSVKDKGTDDTSFRNEFMSGCSENGNYAYCTCTYDEIIKTLGVEGFIEMSLTYNETKVLPKNVYPAVATCMKFY